MNNIPIKLIAFIWMACFFIACGCSNSEERNDHAEGDVHAESKQAGESHEGHDHTEEGGHNELKEEGIQEVKLSDLKFESLGMHVDSLPTRSLSGVVYVNGQLEVAPQHEATITAIIGGNVTSIKVIEGSKVKAGQVLAYLSHPDFSIVQSNYLKAYNESKFLEKEFQRQQRLYEEEIGSGQKFQEVESNYKTVQAEVKSYESQLKQLGLNIANIREGNIYDQVPVTSPIEGNIEKVMIQIGQYVAPTTTMITVINTKFVHADLMVFEKDITQVKVGQKISFSVQSTGSDALTARIYSIGKQFEQNPKAVHIHAEIDQKQEYLIPGMYIMGKILVDNTSTKALPEAAIVEEEGNSYIFLAEKHDENGKREWAFKPVEIRTGLSNDGWVEIKLMEPLPEGALLAWNGAYYLMSEMKKSQTAHTH